MIDGDRAARFAHNIRETCAHQPGARAALRRGLTRAVSHPSNHQAHRVLGAWLHEPDGEADQWALYTVAGMIADQPRAARLQHPPAGPVGNLGWSLARAVRAGLSATSVERRLMVLCRQPLAGLHRDLPRLVAHTRTKLVPVDWAQLIRDLSAWPNRRDDITRRWLQAHYRPVNTEEGE